MPSSALPVQRPAIMLAASLSPGSAMGVNFLRIVALLVLCSLGLQSHAQTTMPQPTTPIHMESVTIGELGTELLVRFDRPISHGQSSLSLTRDGKVVATLHPRLQSAPNVLFVRIPTPTAGAYLVHWRVCPEGGNDRYDGEFTFTVGNATATAADHTRKERQ
jgi:methionine-rich copper-binding protein CopC